MVINRSVANCDNVRMALEVVMFDKLAQIFTREIDTQGGAVFLQTITFFEEQQGFCESSADMFLRQVYGTFIGNAQVNGQLLDEEHGKVVVLCEQSHQGSHGDLANKRRLECRCCRDIVCFCKVRAVTEIFDRFNHTDNLASTTDSVFIDFDLSTQQTHQMRRCLAFAMDDFVFL